MIHTKKSFHEYIGISASTLRLLMNKKHFDELKALGYEKTSRILQTQVQQWLCEYFGVK
ncbi:MAG: hypothetical protein LBU62_04430 [Bacteroidales bacterium]|nr:hypothetical protein [Bacteroidales bacterium]